MSTFSSSSSIRALSLVGAGAAGSSAGAAAPAGASWTTGTVASAGVDWAIAAGAIATAHTAAIHAVRNSFARFILQFLVAWGPGWDPNPIRETWVGA